MRLALPPQSDPVAELFVLQPEHATATYLGWMRDPQVNRYLESRFGEHDLESIRAFVTSMLDSPAYLFLGIRSRELDRHVGNIKLGPIDRHHGSADIGLLVGDREAWGRGVATAAIRGLVEIARGPLGLRKLTAGCYASNGGSQRAFEKVGFALEGRRHQQYLLDGAAEDLVLMGLVLRAP
jgi:RimJ/RimL family protein N-acetyltransferase